MRPMIFDKTFFAALLTMGTRNLDLEETTMLACSSIEVLALHSRRRCHPSMFIYAHITTI